jgi:glycosyltransferase involved in cell wall biosynthesis
MRVLELCLASGLGGLELYFHRCRHYFNQSEHPLLSAVAPCTQLAKLALEDQITHIEIPAARWTTLLTRARELASLLVKQQIKSNVVTSPQQVVGLYYGVNPPPLTDSPPSLPPLPHAAGQMGVFSRIERLTGQHVVLEAINLLKQQERRVNNYFFGVVMDETYAQGLEEYARQNNLSDQVCIAGFHSKPTQLMPQMDIIVMPGLLFDEEKSEQLPKEISKLLASSELRNRLAQAGKTKADREFDAAQHFSKLSQIFEAHLTRQHANSAESYG